MARDLLHATTRLGPARGYYYQLISTLGWTSLPWLPKLRPPTLIMAGDDDPIIPVINARIMHRLIRPAGCTSTTAATSSWPQTPNAWPPRSRRSWWPTSPRRRANNDAGSKRASRGIPWDGLFLVREQFTDEQWSHFITVRRFVDEEVVPVVGPYWERAEMLAAGQAAARAGHRRRGH